MMLVRGGFCRRQPWTGHRHRSLPDVVRP
jgi:hypothetical protein